jgi:hypothetical protein
MNMTLPGVEKRLQGRYEKVVAEHAGHAHPTASGPRVLPGEPSTHAAAMAAWRFYQNGRTTFTRLARPLLDAAKDSAAARCSDFALVPIDWSRLDYKHHPSKADRTQIGNSQDIGYKLLTALLVSDQDGQPLAPLCAQLQTAEGLLSSRFDRPRPIRSALDELAAVMDFVGGLGLGVRPVFVIDAEADSVDHYRQWDRRGFLFLVRADGERHVRLLGEREDGEDMQLSAIAARLGRQQGAFQKTREVDYQGKLVWQYVAEVAVVLSRPAYQDRRVDGQRRRRTIRGKALPLRLVITELRDEQGGVLERWYLLTNVPAQVDAASVALWYYWRWKIESFYKLLKGSGQQLEHWQQQDGRSVLKRLLIASMACVLAWRLAHSQAAQGEEARRTVMRLSGRQVGHGKSYTPEGLLAGLWVLLAMADLLEEMPASRLQEMARFVLGGSCEPPDIPPPRREAG